MIKARKFTIYILCIMLVILAGCSAKKSTSANKNVSPEVAKGTEIISSQASAMKALKTMSDAELKDFTNKAQVDSNGVAIAGKFQIATNDDGEIISGIKVTNLNKNNQLYVVFTDFSLIDEKGAVYPADSNTFAIDGRLPDIKLDGGNSTQGAVLFKVPKGPNKFLLKYNYDSAKNKSLYKPIIVDKSTSTATNNSSNSNTSANTNNTNLNNDYITVSDIKSSLKKNNSILEVQMKINIGNGFVGTMYSNMFILKQGDNNSVKSYSAVFYDNPIAEKSKNIAQDRIDPTPGDVYYTTMYFNINPNNASNFKLSYSFGGTLLPLGNFTSTK